MDTIISIALESVLPTIQTPRLNSTYNQRSVCLSVRTNEETTDAKWHIHIETIEIYFLD
jgi:hypothetical protein